MKKILKRLSSNLIIFGICLLMSGILVVKAITSSSVDYDNRTSGMSATTVEGALNELHDLVDEIEALKANVSTPVGQAIYSSPQILYLDPTNLTKVCRQSDLVASNVNNKTGCMKWYIYAEDDNNTESTSDDKYIAILDHNTTAMVTSWGEASSQLTTDKSGWSNDLTVRLITAEEIAKITGADIALSFNASSSGMFYLDGAYGSASNWQTQVANSSTRSRYAWLYDYTAQKNSTSSAGLCTAYGCNANPNSSYYTDGYWTSTAKDASNEWYVDQRGLLWTFNVYYNSSGTFGVRPVIEFSKSVLLNRS